MSGSVKTLLKEKLLDKLSNENKLIFKRWLKEELVVNYLIYKNKKKLTI